MRSFFKFLITVLAFPFNARLFAIPTLDEFQRYKVDKSGEPEVTWQPLYDYQIYPTAGTTSMNFFLLPIGQGTTSSLGATVGAVKTIHDTNMRAAGQLPSPQGFQIESIEVRTIAGASGSANTFTLAIPGQAAAANAAAVVAQLADVLTITESGVLDLFIMSKSYLQDGPLGKFPPKTHFEMNAAIATTSATQSEVAAVSGRATGQPYFLECPISLTANANFNVSLTWPGVVATPSTFNARLGVILNGWLFRNAQ